MQNSGSGNAKVILQNFFEWCPRDVFLSVRSDNEKVSVNFMNR